MSKWLLTGDWQTTNQNLDVCRQVHEDEIRIGKKYKIVGVIDLGDLKDAYNPVDWKVADFQKKRFIRLDSIFKRNILLMGNHDRIGQYSNDRNWFSLFKGLDVKSVDEPRLINLGDNLFGDNLFACLPYIHDKEELIASAKRLWKEANKYIGKKFLLFHCEVQGADLGLGFKSTTGVRQCDLLFHKYDFCFGGHIHKGQALSEKALYVANPFCFTWGERNQEKGFVIFDDETLKVKRIPSSVPNWYDLDYLKRNKITKVPANTKIQVTVDCKGTNYYEAIEQRKQKIQVRYPKALIYIKTNFLPSAIVHKTVVDANASDEIKIKGYIDANPPEYHKQEQVLKYLLSKLTSLNVRSTEAIRFISVEAENVLSFKKLSFSYENRGVCLVVGENRDWPKHSNGAGKTNFLSMLPIALAGQTFKEQKNDSWAGEHNSKLSRIRLFSQRSNEHPFEINRERRPTKLQFSGRKEETTGLRHRGATETQGVIEQTLGFNIQMLKSSVYIDNSLPKAFLEGTQKDRTDLISKFQNLERFKLAHELVSKDLAKVQRNIEAIESDVEVDKTALAEYKEDYSRLRASARHSLAEYKELVVKNHRRFTRADANFHSYSKKISGKLEQLEQRHNELFQKHIEVDKEIYVITDEMEKQKRSIEKMKRFVYKKCPVCTQRVPASLRERMCAKLKEDLATLKSKFDVLFAEGQEYKEEYDVLFARIQTIKEHLQQLEGVALIAATKHTRAVDALKVARDNIKNNSGHLFKLRSRIEKTKHKIDRSKKLIEEERLDVSLLEYCRQAYSREGIPLYLNTQAVPLLNKVAQEYAEMFTDGEIQVIFNLNGGELEPDIINIHGSKNIAGQSSGEKAWAGIITALSLRELAPKTNLLIMDEPGYGLDPESAKTLGQKLLLLKDRIETVLVVTHNADIASVLQGDNTIVIVKQNKVSRILEA